jgi:type VI secretion system protein ImpC
MAELQTKTAAAEGEAAERPSVLDSIFSKVDIAPPTEETSVAEYDDATANADKSQGAMMAAALRVFVDAVSALDKPVERVDKVLIDGLIAQLDGKISDQLDEIMHHETFQKLESAWTSLKFLVDRTDFRKNAKIELLNVSKGSLLESFEDAPELIQSPLYRHVYTNAYDQPGADPYSTMVSNYEFENNAQDIALLGYASKVGAAALCPFIGAVGPAFFKKRSMDDWKRIPDLGAHMSTVDYTKWNSFRDSPDARFVALTFPRFMLRLPYGPDTVPVKAFNYRENVSGDDHDKYAWGNAAFAMAANMSSAFARDGWCVQIRGPQSGGKLENLPVHLYDVGRGRQMKIPTEVPISETLEFECANLGFVPLSIYEGTDFACFFSANTTQRPQLYDDAEATANSRVNSRLPYIMLGSRISHYLKVLQRENIGSTKDAGRIEKELNQWLSTLVTKMPNPSESVIAKHPLRAGEVKVYDLPDNPGFFRVDLSVIPHFQIEGMDINLSMVSKMPKAK